MTSTHSSLDPEVGDRDQRRASPTPIRHRRRRWWMLGVALAALAVIVIAILITADDDSTGPAISDDAVLELDVGAGDGLASCLAFDVATLAAMSPAFAATASSVEGETVRLRVDQWFAGDAGVDRVELHAPAGLEALIGGIAFEVDQQYLITASGGAVNYCGYSGPATPELALAFEQAFGS